MTRNNDYDRYYPDSGMNVLWAALTGVAIGAAAVFFSDERNRRRMRATVDDWKEKGADKIDEIQGKIEDAKNDVSQKAQDVRQKGLEKVSEELEKTQARVKDERQRDHRRR